MAKDITPQDYEEHLKLTRPRWKKGGTCTHYRGEDNTPDRAHRIDFWLEFTAPLVGEDGVETAQYNPDYGFIMGVTLLVPESQLFRLARGAQLPQWNLPHRDSRFTLEQLREAHEFVHVEDENDQLAVCEMATQLYYGLPDGPGDHSTMQHLLDDYVNEGDGYMGDELIRIFNDTIWEGRV